MQIDVYVSCANATLLGKQQSMFLSYAAEIEFTNSPFPTASLSEIWYWT